MKNFSEAASPSCRARSKKPNLPSSKVQSPKPIQISTKTPEKPPQRTRSRGGVVRSIAEVIKVGKDLQDRKQRNETASSRSKSVRRQISLSPSSPSKPNITDDGPFKLPEKYEILDQFFDRLDTLISILHLRGRTPTFTAISSGIESLVDRRFTYSHLAQLKFVLPEAIDIKKFLVRDERTCCMKHDLHISLNPDAVECDAKQRGKVSLKSGKVSLKSGKVSLKSGKVSLKKLFRSRLKEFWESHPEGDEIPEETLPEPFNHLKNDSILDKLKTSPPTKLPSCMPYTDIVNNVESADTVEKLSVPVNTSVESPSVNMAPPSHMLSSFRPRFSQKFKQNEVDVVQQKSPVDSLQPLTYTDSESSTKEIPSSEDAKVDTSLESSGAPPATPSKTIEYAENQDASFKSEAMSTPAKLASTPIRLMSATPALRPTKRNCMSPEDNTTSSLNKLARRPPRSRSLKFDTPVKNKEVVNEDNAGGLRLDDDVFDVLPENLIQSIREKERMATEERDPAISQAKKRKKNIASLPKLFDRIRLLLRQRSCITKAELISKIISSCCDIVDRNEVDEQLNLLLELAPEWIYEKLVSSGDLLLFINKMLNPETIRASLGEAK
ncbi:CDT1-like protein a, chloroplastic, partial [Mucuna pruriens]